MKIALLQDIPASLGDPEQEVAAVLLEASGDGVSLTVVLVLSLQAAVQLITRLLPEDCDPLGAVSYTHLDVYKRQL